jgi:hypothetical protein
MAVRADTGERVTDEMERERRSLQTEPPIRDGLPVVGTRVGDFTVESDPRIPPGEIHFMRGDGVVGAITGIGYDPAQMALDDIKAEEARLRREIDHRASRLGGLAEARLLLERRMRG